MLRSTGFTPYDNTTLRHGGWTYPLTSAYYYVHTGGLPSLFAYQNELLGRAELPA